MQDSTTCPPIVHPDPAPLAVIDEPSPADLAWLAALNADWHTDEPTPLEALADSEPFDWDAPDPATFRPMSDAEADRLYYERYGDAMAALYESGY